MINRTSNQLCKFQMGGASHFLHCNSVVSSRLPVLTEAVRLMSDPRLGKEDSELVQRAGWRLLPFLVVTSASQLSLASCVARSSVIAHHPLTLNWAEGLEPSACLLPLTGASLLRRINLLSLA